jgi:methylmalonyl-CoA mutase
MTAALEKGVFQGQVGATADARAKNIASAKEKLIGANEFPDIHETALEVLSAFNDQPSIVAAPAGAIKIAQLAPRRLAEPFEELRHVSDAAFAATGVRPKIFLANLGSVAVFTPRANFAKNFFEAGGVEAVFGPETDDVAQIVGAFKTSEAKLACLCSSDAVYSDCAQPVAAALKNAGARLYLAGRPGEHEARLRASGVDNFIYLGCDMFDMLKKALEEAK